MESLSRRTGSRRLSGRLMVQVGRFQPVQFELPVKEVGFAQQIRIAGISGEKPLAAQMLLVEPPDNPCTVCPDRADQFAPVLQETQVAVAQIASGIQRKIERLPRPPVQHLSLRDIRAYERQARQAGTIVAAGCKHACDPP